MTFQPNKKTSLNELVQSKAFQGQGVHCDSEQATGSNFVPPLSLLTLSDCMVFECGNQAAQIPVWSKTREAGPKNSVLKKREPATFVTHV